MEGISRDLKIKCLKKLHHTFNKKSFFQFLSNLFCYVILFGVAFLILYPLLEKVSTIFKSNEDLVDKTVMYIPKEFSLETLRMTIGAMSYSSTLLNTLTFSTIVAIIQVFICTMISYGFARFKFPGRKILFFFVILVLLVPPQVIMSSMYMIFKEFDFLGVFKALSGKPLNLIDSFWPFILLSVTGMGLKNSLYIFMMRQFFRNMPAELEEAGFIDGAGCFRTYFLIMIPNALPMMLTIFLFSFSWQWSDGLYTSMFLREFKVLPNILSSLNTFRLNTLEPVVRTAIVDTGIILVIAPLLLIYLISQRFFIEGISRSGIVG